MVVNNLSKGHCEYLDLITSFKTGNTFVKSTLKPQPIAQHIHLHNTVRVCWQVCCLTFLSWHRDSVTVVSSSKKLRSLPWPNDSPSSRTKLKKNRERGRWTFIECEYHLKIANAFICACVCVCVMYFGSVQIGGLDSMISLLVSSFSRSPPARHHRWYTSSMARSDR